MLVNARKFVIVLPQVAALGVAYPALKIGAQCLPTTKLRSGAINLSHAAEYHQEELSEWIKLNITWVVLVLLSLTAVLIGLFFLKSISEFYGWLWFNTTGEPWTHIMRRNKWLLIVPSLSVLGAYTFSAQATSDDIHGLPSLVKPQVRAKVMMRLIGMLILASTLGFLFGHVIW